MGKDTHAVVRPGAKDRLSKCSLPTEVDTIIQRGDGFTPTPSISRAILAHNRDKKIGLRWHRGYALAQSARDGGF